MKPQEMLRTLDWCRDDFAYSAAISLPDLSITSWGVGRCLAFQPVGRLCRQAPKALLIMSNTGIVPSLFSLMNLAQRNRNGTYPNFSDRRRTNFLLTLPSEEPSR